MSDRNSYHDMVDGNPYVYRLPGDEHSLTKESSRILRPGADHYILSNKECARQFLRLISKGEIAFGVQQRLARILFELHKRCHPDYGAWKDLRPELTATLSVLGESIAEFLKDQGHELTVDEDELNSMYGFGHGNGSIQYGLPIARLVGLKAFIETFTKQFASQENPADLCGEWKLVITEPKNAEYSRAFSGIYGGASEAVITKVVRQQIWHLQFQNFPPWRNWYSLEGAAYKAAAPIVAETLSATVVAVGQLSD